MSLFDNERITDLKLRKLQEKRLRLHSEANQADNDVADYLIESGHLPKKDLRENDIIYPIAGGWECNPSPFGVCVYNHFFDYTHDFCIFCGNPEERK